MSEVTVATQTWKEVISKFFLRKKQSDEEKYIKDLIKLIQKDCEKNSYYGHKAIKDYFSKSGLKKADQEESIDFQRRKIVELFAAKDSLPNLVEGSPIAALDWNEYEKKVKEILEKYKPALWISKASKDSASVSFATHVIKLTHSKIDSPSIYDQVSAKKIGYVTTSSLRTKVIDGAVAGNQFSPIFQFLELECNGVKLATELSNPSSIALSEFSEKNEYLTWNKDFGKALVLGKPASHLLAKQVYFPIVDLKAVKTSAYHLLCNVKSSSIAHAVFERLFSDEVKDNQKLFMGGKFSKFENRYFPRKSKLSVTASNNNNASQLNGKRGGKLYLFSSAPPIWESQAKPPVRQKSFFDTQLRHHISTDNIDYLRDFLIRFDLIDLSIKHPERKKWIVAWVGRIIEDLLAHAAYIQNMEPGWTAGENVLLKREHQLFLDPYRDDDGFQTERKSNGWQSVVCEDFARWLNRELVGRDKKFSPQREHTRIWIELIENPLREHDELLMMGAKAGKVKV